MKNTRRFIAGFSAMAMAAAMAMSASAAEANQINQDSDPKQGDSEVTYNVEAAYTVTIPTGADISGGSDEQSITANDVLLEQGQKITVTLSGASNTASGKSFTAKDESGESTVKYTIKAGDTDVAVGDKVAEFETKTGEQSATLTFTKDADSTPTFAGKHTETLTFNIAVENAVVTPKTYPSLKTGDILHVGDIVTSADSQSGYSFKNYWCSFPKNKSFKLVRADISIRGSALVTESDTGAYYVFLNLSEDEESEYRYFCLGGVEEQEELDDMTGKVIFKATETSDGLEVTVDDKQKISFSVHES